MMQMQPGAASNRPDAISLEDRMGRQIRLRAAVLIEAIRCLEGTSGTRGERLILQRQAVRWFKGSEATSPFSFPRVCESLGLETTRVRRAVFRRCLCPQEASEVQQLVNEIITKGLDLPIDRSASDSAPAAAHGPGGLTTTGHPAAVGPTSSGARPTAREAPDGDAPRGFFRYVRRALSGSTRG